MGDGKYNGGARCAPLPVGRTACAQESPLGTPGSTFAWNVQASRNVVGTGMPEFIVRVGTPDGHVIDKNVHALSARDAEEELRRQGMHVFDAKRGRISLRDLIPRSRK